MCDFFLSKRREHKSLKAHYGVSDRRNVAADVDPTHTLLSGNVNVQNAAATHHSSLFADKTRIRSARHKTMSHHENGQWAGRASRCWIFGNSIVRCEHARVSSVGSRREYKDAHRLSMPFFKNSRTVRIEPGAIHRVFVLQCNKERGITRAHELRRDLEKVARV